MKKTSRLLAVLLIIALLMGTGTAFAASFTVPTAPLSTDDGVIKVIAARAGQIAPLILGADLVASTNLGGSDGSFEGANAILGVFGSDINASPDPWLYNYFYNLNQPDDKKVANATISEHQEDGTPAGDPTIMEELTHRPQIILTQAEGTGDPSPARFESYLNIIATLPENTDDDPTNDYAPSFFTCSTSGLVIQTQNLIELAKAINTVAGENGLRTRYGNPYETAVKYDQYVWGYFFYIQEQIASGAIEKKSSAVLGSTEDSGANWTLAARTAGTGRPSSRLVEYVRDNTDMLNDAVGADVATLEQVLGCDVVIATGNNGATLRAAAAAAGVSEADLPVIIDTLPTCLYGMVMQTHENALGIPLIQSIIYGEELGINPVYAAAYFYQNFFHITDNTALQETVNTLMANATLPAGITTSIAQYDPAAIEALIAQGVDFGTGKTRHEDANPWMPNGAEAETAAFNDVEASAWYYDAVKYVSDNGLMTGVTSSTFAPQTLTSRAMYATILYRAEGEPAVTGSSKFDDVPDGMWYTNAIIWATENDIVTGYSPTTFGTFDNLSREQIAVMLYRYAQYKNLDVSQNVDLGKFTDVGDVASWAQDAMTWAVAESFITGRTATTLVPRDNATRAEVATMTMRYLED